MICDFSRVAFRIFDFPVHWYALAYIVGILLAMRLSVKLAKKSGSKITRDHIESYINYAIIGIIVGGRLGHVFFYEFDFYKNNLLDIFKIWEGGMSFFGGFLGVVTSSYIFCRRNGLNFRNFTDLWAVGAPIGLFLGRIANFINGELPGKPDSEISWAVIFVSDGIRRHPSQIYEALSEGILLFCVMLIAFYHGAYKTSGKLSGIFCIGYGLARFFCEIFREPDSAFSYKLFFDTGLNLNQYLSLGIIFVGAMLLINLKFSKQAESQNFKIN